ncbi:MAG TPA: tetratricopeptide repeat protein [Gemmatimonadales bacterium]|nr:tetratricopeptide repeat protein [Gemmatimonadales bacterium]
MSQAWQRPAVVLAVLIATAASSGVAQKHDWIPIKCDLKPGHYLVNSGVLYLQDAATTQFADKREKDLRDAFKVLDQALRSGQQKNPAAWYYLGRYYVEMQDAGGADSAFTKAVTLAPTCEKDVNDWRRTLWVPVLNAGITAWQSGNTDSAIASFRRANQIYKAEPQGFAYLATLHSNAGQPDSAALYFKLAIQAAQDPKYAKDKKSAMFNLARVYHAANRWDDASQAYKAYLAAYPGDVQAIAGLASVYTAQGKWDDAKAQYTQLFQHADSANAEDLFLAGQEILNVVASSPDTAALGSGCRSSAGAARTGHALTARQIAAKCDSVTRKAVSDFAAASRGDYPLAIQAYEAGLAKQPYHREALYRLAAASALAGDTARTLSAAQRLYAVDPLNRATVRMVAQAWQLKGKPDSTLRYLKMADSIPVDVSVTGLTTDTLGAALRGVFSNFHSKQSQSVSLVFEFLRAKGEVAATVPQTVGPIAPNGNQPFEVKATGAGIVSWRYKRP